MSEAARARLVALIVGTVLAWVVVTGLAPGFPLRAFLGVVGFGMVLAALGVGEDAHADSD